MFVGADPGRGRGSPGGQDPNIINRGKTTLSVFR